MRRYSIEPRTRKYIKGYGLLSFAKKPRLLQTGINASKKVFHRTDKYLGNKTADAVLSKTLATRTKSSE